MESIARGRAREGGDVVNGPGAGTPRLAVQNIGASSQSRRTPGAVGPEIADHALAATAAEVPAAFDLPPLPDLGVTPWAIAHKRHEVLAIALWISAISVVAAI